MAGIYLHIPFCKQACHYCDFHFSTDHQNRGEMVESMVSEIALQADFLQEPVETIYFGGGTPSLLAPAELDKVLSAIHRQFNVVTNAEVTLEANPDDLVPERLLQLHQVGINRLSIGIQSFDNQFLQYLNRAHDAAAARRCLQDARDAGFHNISLDLIYAIPGLTNYQWMETMKEAIQFSPEHISSYSLTIEEKTVFGNWMRKGRLTPTDEETGAQQFELLMDKMESSGFEQYEISNFSRTGFYSRHNSSYWKQAPYLGIGPSAHSFNGTIRHSNVRNNALYIRSLGQGVIPLEVEVLSEQNRINEYILTTLRTKWGCDLTYLTNHFGDELMARCGPYVMKTVELGLIELFENVVRLTRKGKLLADKIAEDLMVTAKES